MRVVFELIFAQFLYRIVPLLVNNALIDVPIFAANGLENGFPAVEHGVELTFPPVFQKLPSLLPQFPIRLCGDPVFEVEGRMVVHVCEFRFVGGTWIGW